MDRQQLYAMNIHYRYYDLEFFFKKCHEMIMQKYGFAHNTFILTVLLMKIQPS